MVFHKSKQIADFLNSRAGIIPYFGCAIFWNSFRIHILWAKPPLKHRQERILVGQYRQFIWQQKDAPPHNVNVILVTNFSHIRYELWIGRNATLRQITNSPDLNPDMFLWDYFKIYLHSILFQANTPALRVFEHLGVVSYISLLIHVQLGGETEFFNLVVIFRNFQQAHFISLIILKQNFKISHARFMI